MIYKTLQWEYCQQLFLGHMLKMAYNDCLEIVGLLGRSVYSDELKKRLPEILIDDLFVPYDGNHLAIVDLKDKYNMKLYFDCTRHILPIYLEKIDIGVVLSVVQFLKPTEENGTSDINTWILPYNLTFSDAKENVIKKIGRDPDDTKYKNSVLILEWQESIYIVRITFDFAYQTIQRITYIGKFIKNKL